MLGEKAQVAAQVLAVEPTAVRRAAHVDDLGAGEEEHLPARRAEAVAPVRLLAEHEERLVEQADLVGGRAPHEQRGAVEPVDLAHLVVLEAARVERVQQRRTRRQLAQEEVLGREPPQRGEPARRALQRPVFVQQTRADDRRLRMRLRELHEPLDRVADDPRVRVQEQEVVARRRAHSGVVAGAEAAVLLLDHQRAVAARDLDRRVRRAVVDHDRLEAHDALERALEPRQRVVADYDDGDCPCRPWPAPLLPGRAGLRGA